MFEKLRGCQKKPGVIYSLSNEDTTIQAVINEKLMDERLNC